MEIIPAVIPESYEDLRVHAENVEGSVPLMQVDICDGIFVPKKSWPFKGDKGEFADLLDGVDGLPFWETLDYEFDLMISKPEDFIGKIMPLGAKRIVFHLGSGDLHKAIEILEREYSYEKGNELLEVGVAIHLNQKIELLKDFVDKISFIEVMGIEKVGYQHVEFFEGTIGRVKEIKELYPDILVSVDGGVDLNNAEELIEAGAERLVSGHAIYEDGNPREAIEDFRDIILG